ncbi:hypothetical protein EJ04DRAFT_582597 [Polyplosphaeria fusca]|uniref:Uncharacterized protein n=1 Tax=Polyplosphaeria fusca TaxID=682080 RepID=A0A9P4QKR4_9PLEO|nr:hypothetical protein EJ04DRAFT_582597 [Polyplosphaeria fusca]
MASRGYPPSPPHSPYPEPRRLPSYSAALRKGNVFLSLPRNVRDLVYDRTLCDSEIIFGEVPHIRDFTFPDICQACDLFYGEVCQVLLKSTTFTLSSDPAIFNFMVILEEPDIASNGGGSNVRRLEFTSIRLFERDVFGSSSAAKLIRRCENISFAAILINFEHFKWFKNVDGTMRVDTNAINEQYDVDVLLELKCLDTISLSLHPSMSLQNKIVQVGRCQEDMHPDVRVREGLEGLWGMKAWLEGKAFEAGRIIDVGCPVMEDVFPDGIPNLSHDMKRMDCD